MITDWTVTWITNIHLIDINPYRAIKLLVVKPLYAEILGHLNTFDFLFGTNGKLMVFRCPSS